MPELTEELITKMMPRIKQIMEEFKLDKRDEVIQLLKENYKEVSERTSSTRLSESRIFNKALGKVCSELGQTGGGERFNIFILSYERPRDWNEKERGEILDAWAKGPRAQLNLTQQGKVMQMKKSGKEVVVSKIDRWAISTDGLYVVLSGKEIEPGEKPIPRDTHKTLRDDKTPNRFFSNPLLPRWSISLVGVAEIETGFKPFEARVYGQWADPTHANYLPKIASCFGTYKAVFGVDEKNSNDKQMRFNYINAITPIEEPATVEEIIYNLVDSGIIHAYAKQKGETDPDQKMYLVDLADLEEFHDEVIARRDDNGDIEKTDRGYDRINWNKFGIGIFYVTAKTDTEIGNSNLRFRDWTGKSNGGFTNETIFFEEEDFPLECAVSFRTNRTPQRWDAEARIRVDDPIHGDVTLGRLLGVKKCSDILEE